MDARKRVVVETMILSVLKLSPEGTASLWDRFQWLQAAVIANGKPEEFEPAKLNDVLEVVRYLEETRQIMEITIRSGNEDHKLYILPNSNDQ